jgi:hypothetical protein
MIHLLREINALRQLSMYIVLSRATHGITKPDGLSDASVG